MNRCKFIYDIPISQYAYLIQIMKSIINLTKTPLGYSLLQGDVEINRPSGKVVKEKSYSVPKKFAQQNFTIYPYICSKDTDNHKYILIPARSQWFNLNSVHQIEKKALPEWFKIKKGILATMSNIKFQKHEELYKKYRNYIIELGKNQYVTPSKARKGLAGDACAIIRIHKFLQKWGLINYIHKKPSAAQFQQHSNAQNVKPPLVQLSKRKDGFERDKLIISRSYNKDDLELLKKITRKSRQICHFCEGITGVVWYEYSESLFFKEFVSEEGKNGKSIKNVGDAINYKLVVCATCLFEGSIPAILNVSDFKKRSILDQFQDQNGTTETDKKRNAEQNKVADSIEKNKFKINKSAEQLKMTSEHVFKILMTMPMQKLQKISRIQVQTDEENQDSAVPKASNAKEDKSAKIEDSKHNEQSELQQKLKRQISLLESEQRQTYERFLQYWLLKMNLKLERLGEWENGVLTKYKSAVRLEKNLLAAKISSLAKNI